MTTEMSVNVTDETRRQREAPAAVADAVQARIDAERARCRQESAEFAEYMRQNPVEGLDEVTALSNEMSLRAVEGW